MFFQTTGCEPSLTRKKCCGATRMEGKRGRWRRWSGSIGSGTLLLLLPKCPMCIAAYLALGMGAGVAMEVSVWLRPALAAALVASLLWLAVRRTRAHHPA